MARRKRKHTVTRTELADMLPTFLIGGGVVLLVCIIIGIVTGSFDYRLYTGLVVGLVVSFANFGLMGYAAESIMQGTRSEKKARFNANASYGLRYIGMFVIFAVLLMLGWIHMATAFIPLFFPRIHYTIKYGFKKG